LDYTLERFYTVRQSVDFSQRHRGMAIGNGAVFLGLLAVPILGLFLAPALATAAATIAAVQRVPMPLLKEKHEGLRKDML
jgi:CysZ protein